MGWFDHAAGSVLTFLTWWVIGLGKSMTNHPNIRQDRWTVFFVSLAGLAALVLTVLFFCLTLTQGYSWWWAVALALTTIIYCFLTAVQFALDVPPPEDTFRAFG